MTISGPGANLVTIDASGNDPTPTVNNGDGSRVFNVDDGNIGTLIDVTLSGLTLTGGDADVGGGILSRENVQVVSSTIIGNATAGPGGVAYNGGGIYSGGDPALPNNLSIISSVISGNQAGRNGGGVSSLYTTVSITGSTIIGNQAAGDGGGIKTFRGLATITNSNISGNSALGTNGAGSGGGIHNTADGFGGGLSVIGSTISGNSAAGGGGGIFDNAGQAGPMMTTISNTTISGNTAAGNGGGLRHPSGVAVIRHSTITDNTATIASGSGISINGSDTNSVEIYSSLIAGNVNSDLDAVALGATSFQSDGYNLVGSGNAVGQFVQPGDQTGVTEPDARSLADNGGLTFTHAVLPGSPAIDMGDPAAIAGVGGVPLSDQRGDPFSRVADGNGDLVSRIDIGAYERQTVASSNFVVDTLVDDNDGDYSLGDRSLREVIGVANGSVGAETITFAPSLTSGGPATILLTKGELAIRDAVTINGPGANLLTIDASGNDPTPAMHNNGDGTRVFNIDDGNTVTQLTVSINSLTMTGGDVTAGNGGGIRSLEQLTLSSSTITGNSAVNGGGIYNKSGSTAAVTDSMISGNSSEYGGGIFNTGTVTVIGSAISGNTSNIGGGIDIEFGSATITDSAIRDNSAASVGGGISSRAAT